jgi:Domain of unknown function (DUF4124)
MRLIGIVLFSVLMLPGVAQAQLYRWVDRETGQVKFSNTPPPWFGDPEKQRRNPPVEVIRYRGSAEKPTKPAPEPEKPAAATPAVATLEARWLELARSLASLPPGTDIERAGPGIRQQMEDYQSISAELDRIDPGGTERRRSQQAAVIENARRAPDPALRQRSAD